MKSERTILVSIIFISLMVFSSFIKSEVNYQEVKTVILTKNFKKTEGNFELNYNYPFLNETLNKSNSIFNTYFKNAYLKPYSSIKDLLNNDDVNCNKKPENIESRKRFLEYKIYHQSDNSISILLFKANHPEDKDDFHYTFRTLNYDLKNATFLDYNSVFKENSEDKLLSLINSVMSKKLEEALHYSDCWHLTKEHFEKNKNKFALSENSIKFYFDDCTICSSYVGEYAIEISDKKVKHLLKNNDLFLKI